MCQNILGRKSASCTHVVAKHCFPKPKQNSAQLQNEDMSPEKHEQNAVHKHVGMWCARWWATTSGLQADFESGCKNNHDILLSNLECKRNTYKCQKLHVFVRNCMDASGEC